MHKTDWNPDRQERCDAGLMGDAERWRAVGLIKAPTDGVNSVVLNS